MIPLLRITYWVNLEMSGKRLFTLHHDAGQLCLVCSSDLMVRHTVTAPAVAWHTLPHNESSGIDPIGVVAIRPAGSGSNTFCLSLGVCGSAGPHSDVPVLM